MVHTKLYLSQVILQIWVGTLTPLAILALTQVVALSPAVRKRIYGDLGPEWAIAPY